MVCKNVVSLNFEQKQLKQKSVQRMDMIRPKKNGGVGVT
jgi:hypothetical protein